MSRAWFAEHLARSQFLHRYELLFDAYPFANDYEIYTNTLWALSEYTEEMGATRVVPGSHKQNLSHPGIGDYANGDRMDDLVCLDVAAAIERELALDLRPIDPR